MKKNAELKKLGFVNLADAPYPKFYFDLRYAGTNNFTKQKIYDFETAWLRKEAADALAAAWRAAQKPPRPLTFIIYDCYRPAGAHKKLWEIYPDPGCVAPPEEGSRHSRGMAVDLTLAEMDGTPLKMPTEFDSFSPKAFSDYDGKDLTEEEKTNRELLKKIMTSAGFDSVPAEWWHFDKPGWQNIPVCDVKPEY